MIFVAVNAQPVPATLDQPRQVELVPLKGRMVPTGAAMPHHVGVTCGASGHFWAAATVAPDQPAG